MRVSYVDSNVSRAEVTSCIARRLGGGWHSTRALVTFLTTHHTNQRRFYVQYSYLIVPLNLMTGADSIFNYIRDECLPPPFFLFAGRRFL